MKPGIYRHFKGNYYQVIDVAKHSETGDDYVVYRPLYGEGKLWIRPYPMFTEIIESEGELIRRFEYIAEDVKSLSKKHKAALAKSQS